VNKVISFLKNLAENDDLRKREDLRGFYGNYSTTIILVKIINLID
jgi:hypothetical protein